MRSDDKNGSFGLSGTRIARRWKGFRPIEEGLCPGGVMSGHRFLL